MLPGSTCGSPFGGLCSHSFRTDRKSRVGWVKRQRRPNTSRDLGLCWVIASLDPTYRLPAPRLRAKLGPTIIQLGEVSMRAAVLTEINKPLQILDLEQEGPKAGEVRVQVKAAGVCMSDYHIMNGDWPLPLPMVLGHEAAGIVVELGPGVQNVKKGDHVIFSFRPHCGHCRYCASGRSVLCTGRNDSPRWLMHDGSARLKLNGEPVNQMARIGTFSEHVVCPAEQVVKIREDLPWTHAAII